MNRRKVIAGIATIAERSDALIDTVESLKPQVDLIYIYCNEVEDLDFYYGDLIYQKNIIFLKSSEYFGDITDAGKFVGATEEMRICDNAYFFSVDDDIVYPPDYVLYLISKLKKYNNQKVVGIHGKRFKTPIRSFYRDRNNIEWFHNGVSLIDDKPVHMLGTGLLAFPMDLVKLNINDIDRHPRCSADIHFARACQDQNIGMICVAHSTNSIKLSDKINHNKDTIYAKLRHNDRVQTHIINGNSWNYY